MNGLWVRAWNGVANQTEIRVVNSSKFSFKIELQVGGVTYQEALAPFVRPEGESAVEDKTGKPLFSSVSLPCGYFWYTVKATRFDPFANPDVCSESHCLYRVFGGRTVYISEGNRDTDTRMICVENDEVVDHYQRIPLKNVDSLTSSLRVHTKMLEESSCKSVCSSRSISSGESTDVDDEVVDSCKETKLAESCVNDTLRKSLSRIPSSKSEDTRKIVLKCLQGMWVLDSKRSDDMDDFMQLKGISYLKRKAARHITQRQKIQPLTSDLYGRIQIKNMAGPVTEVTEVDINSNRPLLNRKGEEVFAYFADCPVELKHDVLPVCILVRFILPNGDKQCVYHGISRTNKNEKHMFINYESVQSRRSANVHLVSVRSL